MLTGIPVYVCATASVPLVYALVIAGVSPGAGFAFLMTGPATNAATIATIWKVMGKRTTVIYLCVMLAGAMAGGLLLDQIITGEQIVGSQQTRWMLPMIVKQIAAVVLLSVLFVAVIRPYLVKPLKKKNNTAQTIKIKITGMTCSHCAESIQQALLQCAGVENVEVDLVGGEALIYGTGFDINAIRETIEKLGYTLMNESVIP